MGTAFEKIEKTTERNMLAYTKATNTHTSLKRKDQLQAKNKHTKNDPH